MKQGVLILLMLMPLAATAQQKTTDCYCTDKSGLRIELGERICMSVDGRQIMAKCQMSQNNPMWREIAPQCLSS
ncbi:MAG: hypothetical protein AAF678_10535 [Pseudomonadota bacterium]